MEEVLTGETAERLAALRTRASLLVGELAATAGINSQLPDAREIASTVLKTFQIPDIAALRPHLVAELPVYAMVENGAARSALAGRIDAMAVEDGKPLVVVDWKSDVAPAEQDVRDHAAQLGDYLAATGAPRGMLVYMSTGVVHWVD
jgi:ATP-dependent exoDNAse (exonuclease V) beta subunit